VHALLFFINSRLPFLQLGKETIGEMPLDKLGLLDIDGSAFAELGDGFGECYRSAFCSENMERTDIGMHHWLCGLYISSIRENKETTYTRKRPHQCTDHISSLDDVGTYLLKHDKLVGLIGIADDLILKCVRFLSLYVLHDLANVLYDELSNEG
jgi:hypothetical protein